MFIKLEAVTMRNSVLVVEICKTLGCWKLRLDEFKVETGHIFSDEDKFSQ